MKLSKEYAQCNSKLAFNWFYKEGGEAANKSYTRKDEYKNGRRYKLIAFYSERKIEINKNTFRFLLMAYASETIE